MERPNKSSQKSEDPKNNSNVRPLAMDIAKTAVLSTGGTLLGPDAEIFALNRPLQSEPGSSVNKYKETPLNVNDHKINLVGLSHDYPTFVNHQQELKKIVSSAPFIILEYFNDKERDMTTFSSTGEQSINGMNSTEAFFFLSGLTAIQYKKDIVLVNPEADSHKYMDSYLKFGIPAALVPSDIKNFIQRMQGKNSPRRDFLRVLGYGASALTWLSQFDIYRHSQEMNKGKKQDEIDVGFRWNLIDFRDAVSAQSISTVLEKYSHEISNEQSIPVIQGAGHTAGVIKYLEEPASAYKMLGYTHFKLTSNPIRRYHYNQSSNNWTLVDKISDISPKKPNSKSI